MSDEKHPACGTGLETAAKPVALKAECLEEAGVAHGFFLRTGGVSEGIYASLNCGRGSGDVRDHVEENRARVARALGVSSNALIGPHQYHSAEAVIVQAPFEGSCPPQADAIVTNIQGLAVSVLTADCVPLLMADKARGVVAAVHAGWKGAKSGIIENAIEAMEKLGARATEIVVGIGPAISEAAYEVGPAFKEAFTTTDDVTARYFSETESGGIHFDLPRYVRDRLSTAGITRISDVGLCTYGNESILFSYRRSCHRKASDYGRQISAIVLG